MKVLHGKQAAPTYSPKKGQPVVIYTHRFRPEHYRDGVELVTKQFPDAQLALGQNRHNIFLERPADSVVVNVTFFYDGAAFNEWQECDVRLKIVERMRPMLDGPVDIQVYNINGVVGIGE